MDKTKLRELVRECYYEVLIEQVGSDILIPAGKETLGRYPKVVEVLSTFFGREYTSFVRDVKYTAYKPTTFQIILANGTNFYIEWSGKGFLVVVPGSKLDISKVNEYQKAQRYINDLLKTGPVQSTADMEAQDDLEGDVDFGGGGDFGSDIGDDDVPDLDAEEPESPDEPDDLDFDI